MLLTEKDLDSLCECAVKAAKKAGDLIASYASKTVAVQHKTGGNSYASQVVTEVDLLCDEIISRELTPSCEEYDLALLTEESEDDEQRLHKDYFWSVDPVDGTLAFIESSPGYSVSIALLSKRGVPVIGVVYDPLTHTLYSAVKGKGARRNGEPWALELVQNKMDQWLIHNCDGGFVKRTDYPKIKQGLESIAEKYGLKGIKTKQMHGAVLNACLVLEYSSACYFKFPKPEPGGGSLWDFAATAVIFNELGAFVSDMHGQMLQLNRAESTFMNHRGILYATHQALAEDIQALYQGLNQTLISK